MRLQLWTVGDGAKLILLHRDLAFVTLAIALSAIVGVNMFFIENYIV